MHNTLAYILFLVVGAVLVFVDGYLIRRSGTTYMQAAYPETRVADSMNQLITVLFHLAALGILALVSTIDLTAGGPLETLVARVGVMLLILAAAHAITIWALVRVRARQQERHMRNELAVRTEQQLGNSATAAPQTHTDRQP